MNRAPLLVVLVEDSLADADLIRHALRATAYDAHFVHVADEDGLRLALSSDRPDLVLSDFSLPGFSGQDALRIAREMAPDTPFIFVSGTIGEELAIDALQRGAADYVLKDNLRRLPSAIDRAIAAARERTARVDAERALRRSEERFRDIVEHTDDWIWECDREGAITYSNPVVESILGWKPEELIGRDFLDHVAASERDGIMRRFDEHAAARQGWQGWLMTWAHRDGSRRTLESNGQPIGDDQGGFAGFRGVDRDVTERIAQDRKIRQLARIQAVLGAVSNAVLHARDADELLRMTCSLAVRDGGFLASTMIEVDDVAGHRLAAYDGDRKLVELVVEALQTGEPQQSTPLQVLRSNGEAAVAVLGEHDDTTRRMRERGVRAKVALSLGSPPWGVLVLHSDDPNAFDAEELALLSRLASEISHGLDFIRKSERLEHLAYRNALTGLPNRAALGSLLESRLAGGAETVALVDVVNFHVFNDSRGREFSDQLLQAIAERLVRHFGSGALVAHPADDSFAIVCKAGDDDGVDPAVERMMEFLEGSSREPFDVRGEKVYADLRCGLLHAPRHGADVATIERNVMSALSEARNTGARLVVYDEAFSARAQKRIDIERELRMAVDRQQFELFLQPKFNARTQTLTGAEALLRWRHPERGLISPGDFIPLLEETGLILPVGRWILQQAMAISSSWQRRGHSGLRLAINLSAVELNDENYLRENTAMIREAGAEHGVDVELTESLVMDDIGRSIRLLQSLRDVGCGVAIDDYGTGYSSLNYLSRLPCDTLKIDRSFVADIARSPESLALVTNTISLAHALGLRVVAEGVEEEEQAKLLRLLRCDELQGWLLGRATSIAEFDARFID